MPLLDRVYEAWSFNAIPRIGQLVAGDGEALFLSGRIDPQIPQPAEFRRDDDPAAGFDRVTWRNYSGGIAALHSGWKL